MLTISYANKLVPIHTTATSSIHSAPPVILPAWCRMVGTAIVPTAENPVRNFPASAHPPEESPLGSPKNKYGMGTKTYMKAVVFGRLWVLGEKEGESVRRLGQWLIGEGN